MINTQEISTSVESAVSTKALSYFLALAADNHNWRGNTCLGGNVPQGRAENGYLTDLKKKGFLTTFDYEGNEFVHFEPKGVAVANFYGIEIEAGAI